MKAGFCQTRRGTTVLPEKEMLTVMYLIKQFKLCLLERELLLRTDQGSLIWLHKMKEPEGQTARWLQQLGSDTFRIEPQSWKTAWKYGCLV